MWKCLAIVGLLAFGVMSCAEEPLTQQRVQQQNHSQAQVDTAHPSASTSISEDVNKKGRNEYQSRTKKYIEDAFVAGNLSNWILAGLGVIGGIIAGCTLQVIYRQTQILKDSVVAAQTSADAAKASADIATGVSIPTLVVHEFGIGNVGNSSLSAFFQCPKIKITVKNYGQTPAFLKWWSLCFTCDELPDIPLYLGDGIALEKIVVPPGETFNLPELASFQTQGVSIRDVEAIIRREKRFHAYGYICYGDVFGSPLRRFKFCETAFNILEDETIYDWYEGFGPPLYTGTDQVPVTPQEQKEPENSKTDSCS